MKRVLICLIVFSILFVSIVYADQSKNGRLQIEVYQNIEEDNNYNCHLHVDGMSGAIETNNGSNIDYLVFDSLGDIDFTIPDNQELIFKGLPIGSKYEFTIEEKKDYIIKINDLELNRYSGIVEADGKISITSFTNKKGGIVDDSKNPKDPVSENPSTSDKIVIVSLLFFMAMLISYSLLKIYRFKRYEGN